MLMTFKKEKRKEKRKKKEKGACMYIYYWTLLNQRSNNVYS